MKILSIQEAYTKKFERQKQIKELQYHAAGHCVHIGKLSPGCLGCFVVAPTVDIMPGIKCNLNCPYCAVDRGMGKPKKTKIRKLKLDLIRESCLPNFNIQRVSFTGGGEPLLYIDTFSKYMKIFHDFERYMKKRPWYYLYTNGVLANVNVLSRLKDMGFDEIRFHLGATNFSKKVYKNLESAIRYFKVVTVETAAWPPHRKKLFEMLPIIEDIGVKHLNIEEIEINKNNYNRISRILPNGEIYQCYEMHLYDGGLVYDIIEEVLKKKYSYSVLDCSCFVKSIQESPAKTVCCDVICYQDVKGMCADYGL